MLQFIPVPQFQWGALVKRPYPNLKHEHSGQIVFSPGKEVSEEKSEVRFNLILTLFTEVICCAVISVK